MSVANDRDVFKETFKYYKSKHPPPSLREVLDFRQICNDKNFTEATPTYFEKSNGCKILGLKNFDCWKMYSLKPNPGLLYIPNPFTPKGQRYWIRKCLKDYPKKPNKTNIDPEKIIQDWWEFCKESVTNRKQYLKKLRWTTLGYHHDWDTKVYTEESRNDFPAELSDLCCTIAKYAGYEKYKPQAAIVNYYHMDSTLSPHTDHSEKDLDAPLVSISFGQSAIFLIGGHEKSQKPSAIRLHSGDVVIMCKQSRLSYHAVPKILSSLDSPWNEEDRQNKCIKKHSSDDVKTENLCEEWEEFDSYIQGARININVRQVLNENQNSLAGD